MHVGPWDHARGTMLAVILAARMPWHGRHGVVPYRYDFFFFYELGFRLLVLFLSAKIRKKMQ